MTNIEVYREFYGAQTRKIRYRFSSWIHLHMAQHMCHTLLFECYRNQPDCLNKFFDDLITGTNSVQELIMIKEEVSAILNEAGFHLYKWASNHSAIVENVLNSMLNFDKDSSTSTLGLQWNPKEDQFRFNIDTANQVITVSKRSILSSIAHIFDLLWISLGQLS